MQKTREKTLENFFDKFIKGDQLNSKFHTVILYQFFAVLCSCIFIHAVFAARPEINEENVITAIEKKYAGKSFETNFTQISKLAALDITEKASGRASFSHPGKMKWEYMTPEQHEIITNGKTLWIYRPQENQVMQGDATQFFKAGSGGAFMSDISLIRKNYLINIKEVTTEYIEIELTAKKNNPEISLIVIRILQ